MKKIINHLKVVLTHKYYVCKYCFKAGLYKQGLLHDFSKFSPTEFLESVKYFQGNRSPIDACKEENGMSYAWLHHKGINKHHYEYWQDNFDKGTTHLTMPFEYALEMVCDYLGAGNAYMKEKFTLQGELDWWKNKTKTPIAMSPEIFKFVDTMMKIMAKQNNTNVLKKHIARRIYDKCINK